MIWFEYLSIIALLICLISCLYHLYRIIRMGNPPEYARKAGQINKALHYSFTGAMSPKVKESARLHLPTYVAGVIYHLGTFLAIFIFFLILLDLRFSGGINWGLMIILLITGICGIAVLIKRISKRELRTLSNPDDYISNIMVTLFQLTTALTITNTIYLPAYFIVVTLLLLYIPMGKLMHVIYFFSARYHLGYFYGWRDVWPPERLKNKTWKSSLLKR